MLEGYLEKDRAEADYKQTVLAYRKVYLITPEAPEATPALVAEAELYQAMGRLFDPKYFQQAIDRYNFLLKQYPGTRFRADVLFAIGKIQKDDLKKPADAQETFKQFLKRYPRSDKAADAQQALKELADASQPNAKQAAAAPAPSRPDQTQGQQKSSAADAQPGNALDSDSGAGKKSHQTDPLQARNVPTTAIRSRI